MDDQSVVIIGAGPAGLTAAHEALKHNLRPLVLESGDKVGGLARTEVYKGYRFDIGGHRFFTKVPQIQQLWQEMLGPDFCKVRRLSRIYYREKFFRYPLELFSALWSLGMSASLMILASYLRWKIRPYKDEQTLEHWVTNRFGRRLYRTFFKTYTEKVWGIPCDQIQADWAAQRIRNLSLKTALLNAVFGGGKAHSLIKEFDYPRLGPGMMWERFASSIQQRGGEVRLRTSVTCIKRQGMHITGVVSQNGQQCHESAASHFISSMPLTQLVERLDPPPPPEVLQAASKLRYRAFLIVGLIVSKPDLFPDNWIYVHSPGVKVGRIQNFKNWSPAMVASADKTSVGMEYFCDEGDPIWTTPDQELIRLAARELAVLGFAREEDVEDGVVIRQPRAYPVYDREYQTHVDVLREYLARFDNLQTVGRNGMHRYNNQDHSMLTALLAVRNICGEKHDLWNVNVQRSYHEELGAKRGAPRDDIAAIEPLTQPLAIAPVEVA